MCAWVCGERVRVRVCVYVCVWLCKCMSCIDIWLIVSESSIVITSLELKSKVLPPPEPTTLLLSTQLLQKDFLPSSSTSLALLAGQTCLLKQLKCHSKEMFQEEHIFLWSKLIFFSITDWERFRIHFSSHIQFCCFYLTLSVFVRNKNENKIGVFSHILKYRSSKTLWNFDKQELRYVYDGLLSSQLSYLVQRWG